MVSRTDFRMSSSIGSGGEDEARRSTIGQALQSGTRSGAEPFEIRDVSAESEDEEAEAEVFEDIHHVVPPAELRPGK